MLVCTILGHDIGRILSTSAGPENVAGRLDLELDSGHLDVVNVYEQPSCECEVSGFAVGCGRYALSEYANSKSNTTQGST